MKRKALLLGFIMLITGAIMFGGLTLAAIANPALVMNVDSKLRTTQGLHAQPIERIVTAEGEITTVEIECGSKDVRVVVSDQVDKVTATYWEDYEDDAEFVESEGVFRLKIKSKIVANFAMFNWLIDGYYDRDDVVVTVPESAAVNYTIKVTSGSVTMDKLSADNLSIKTSSGNISLTDVKANVMDVVLTSGNVKIQSAEIGTAKVKLTSGNISISNIKAAEAVFGLTSGNVTVGNADIMSIDVSATSGNIRLSGLAGEKGDYNLDLDVTSGSIRIWGDKYNGKDNNHTDTRTRSLRLKATSGTIRVAD